MSNPNDLASSFMAMAQAVTELPMVKAELEAERTKLIDAMNSIQRLELRLIDSTHELADARAATRKAEVERDHAETMFLETDDKLQKLLGVFGHFQTEVGSFTKASEPEPVAAAPAVDLPTEQDTPAQAIPSWATPEVDHTGDYIPKPTPDPFDRADAAPQGESAVDPTLAQASPTTIGTEPNASGSDLPASEDTAPVATPGAPEVAIQPDPTLDTAQAEPIETITDAISTGAGGSVNVYQPTTTDTCISADNVGYHNEPLGEAWEAYAAWCGRMNDRYGPHGWPPRNVPSVA